MPTLDVNDAFDPSFWDNIVVIRRIVTIDQHGRARVTEKPISARAVVIAASPNDLQRLPEAEWMNKAIQITTPFRLQGPSIDEVGTVTHPDHILWHGSIYVIRIFDDYAGYGRGFTHAIAVSINAVDPPPPAQGGDNPIPTPLNSVIH